MTGADEAESAAVRWLLRRTEADWTPADEIELEAWLSETPHHRVAFWRQKAGWEATGRLAAIGEPGVPVAREARVTRRWWPAAIAASLALVATPAAWLGLRSMGGAHTFTTAVGGFKAVPLGDGSRIELNTSTQLRAEVGARQRQAWLDGGEAYFEIAHDPAHPFVVHAGPKLVTVLGTKFVVRRDGNRVEVGVIDGRVRVDNASAPRSALPPTYLTRGDMLVGQGGSTLLPAPSIAAVRNELAWREGMLTFQDVTLADAANEFNRYSDTHLEVVGAVATTRIRGSFEARNAETFAELLQRTYGMKVADRDGRIIIFQ